MRTLGAKADDRHHSVPDSRASLTVLPRHYTVLVCRLLIRALKKYPSHSAPNRRLPGYPAGETLILGGGFRNRRIALPFSTDVQRFT
jgi:hypothetical protein